MNEDDLLWESVPRGLRFADRGQQWLKKNYAMLTIRPSRWSGVNSMALMTGTNRSSITVVCDA